MRAALLCAAAAATQASLVVDKDFSAEKFWGIGGLSGGGATSRLLVDYKEPQRTQILDYLFTPNFGANLQVLKVEIGGDAQSTDGTETSHMHTRDDLDCTRGYEWWLMKEAKKRNPEIKLYGLPWAFPGWVGNDPVTGKPSGSPFTYPNQTSQYIVNWVKGAKEVHGLDIDYLGVWNERSSSAAYTASLKKQLSTAGYSKVQIVAKDGGADICNDLAKDPSYAATVDIIGLHYPSDYSDYSVCHSLNKPFWASEESSSYDDFNGAACWARVVNSHYVRAKITSSIMWNLVGSYYHGTNWYASSMLTAVEPWSGNYDTLEVVWATAHVTQFTKFGWNYLEVGKGSGILPKGGYYTTLVDPSGSDFTILAVKISHDHARCTRPGLPNEPVYPETVTFTLASNLKAASLGVWKSNYETNVTQQFERQADVKVVDGKFSLNIQPGDYYTVSTVTTAKKGHHDSPASTPFPLPHNDDFNEVVNGQEGAYLTDQIGAFEVHSGVLRQMVPQLPIVWDDHNLNGPMTLIGMKEFQDISVQVDVKLATTTGTSMGCVATRVNQKWHNGVVLCVQPSGQWNLTYGGPPQSGTGSKQIPVASGFAAAIPAGSWVTLKLATEGSTANFAINDKTYTHAIRNIDNGFGALGANTWLQVEYDNLKIDAVGNNWNPTSPCGSAKAGDVLKVRDCVPNGRSVADQQFKLKSNWQIVHIPSGLCAETQGTSSVVLAACDATKATQQFRNDYTRVRNAVVPFTTQVNGKELRLQGNLNGDVTIGDSDDWDSWSFYPNTNQVWSKRDTHTLQIHFVFV